LKRASNPLPVLFVVKLTIIGEKQPIITREEKNMRKAGAFILILLFSFNLLYAQEDEPNGGDWDYYNIDNYSHGDQTFVISLLTIFPVVFYNKGSVMKNNFSPPVGGTGSLSYNYFLTNNIFLGGEISGAFIPTISNNMYYGIFLGVRTGYQFYIWRLEFPLNITVGMAWHQYLNYKNYSFSLKGGGAVYFRFNSEWSFGIHSNWYWIPQRTDDPSKNVYGNLDNLFFLYLFHFYSLYMQRSCFLRDFR